MANMNNKCIEIKPHVETIHSIKIQTNDTEILQQEIESLVAQSSNKYQNKPVIIDIHDKNFQANDLAVLVEILAQNELIAIGVRTSKKELIDFVKFSGLAVFDIPKVNNKPKADVVIEPNKIKTTQNNNKDKVYKAPVIVSIMVDSNNQVYAKESDLVLLEPVNIDAEVLSYGSISAYQEVRGKVFAGISGDTKATIFIHSFKAQLISIAGVYKKFESIPTKLFARPVIVDLLDGKLRFKVV